MSEQIATQDAPTDRGRRVHERGRPPVPVAVPAAAEAARGSARDSVPELPAIPLASRAFSYASELHWPTLIRGPSSDNPATRRAPAGPAADAPARTRG